MSCAAGVKRGADDVHSHRMATELAGMSVRERNRARRIAQMQAKQAVQAVSAAPARAAGNVMIHA